MIDFRDPDDLVRPYGAEDDDYRFASLVTGIVLSDAFRLQALAE